MRTVVFSTSDRWKPVVSIINPAAGLPVAIVNPRQVRAFAQAIRRTAKTDAIDAGVLALFAARVEFSAIRSARQAWLAATGVREVRHAQRALSANSTAPASVGGCTL
jgi:transposase